VYRKHFERCALAEKEGVMRVVAVENLAEVLFAMYLAHDRTISDELRDEIAGVEIVGAADESEVVTALGKLHDLIEAERKQRH
jgi:hypothetical protein